MAREAQGSTGAARGIAAAEGAAGPSYAAIIEAFGKVADGAAREDDLDAVLHAAARQVRTLFAVGRCSVYLREGADGLFRGRVAETGADDDAAVRRLVCGTESDGFTREILATRAPVLIADARRDPRPVRAAMRGWDIRTMLGVPMIARGDVVGLLFLDDRDVRAFGEEEIACAFAFATLLSTLVDRFEAVAELRGAAAEAEEQARLLQRGRMLEERASALALRAGSVQDVADGLASVLKRAVFVHGPDLRLRAVAGDDGGTLRSVLGSDVRRALVDAVAGAADGTTPVIVGPFPDDGLHHRFLVAPIQRRTRRGGYVVVPEVARPLGPVDAAVSRRVAGLLGLALSARRRGGAVERQARRILVRDLLHGTVAAHEIEDRARQHGADPARRHAVVLFRRRDGAGPVLDAADVDAALARSGLPGRPLVEADDRRNVAALLPYPDGGTRTGGQVLREHVERAVAELAGDDSVVATLSSPCDLVAAARAYAEAQQVQQSLLTVGVRGHGAVLASEDLGVGRLILAALDHVEAERFAEQTLGPLVDPEGDDGHGDLVRTLGTFFDSCRSVRRAATELGVHENTIRYRLARVRELTGLDIAANPDDQLSAQLAVLILRLQGHWSEAPEDAADEPLVAVV
jgi:sugar diacid utilization regulator